MLKKQVIDFETDPLWKVSEVRELLKKHEILKPVPTHQTLVNYVLDGTLDGFQTEKGFYLVRQKSIVEWIKSLQERLVPEKRRRILQGSLSGLNIDLSFDEIEKARYEAWGGNADEGDD